MSIVGTRGAVNFAAVPFALQIDRHDCFPAIMTDAHAAITVREALASDWPAIWPIIAAVAAEGTSYTLEPDISEADARIYWMGAGQTAFVAERDGVVVGTYTFRANQRGRGAHVCNVGYMVRADAAGGGVGSAMCVHSLDHARAQGFLAMQFNYVVSTNTRAVRLWQAHGFHIVGTVPLAFRHPTAGLVDIHVMHRML